MFPALLASAAAILAALLQILQPPQKHVRIFTYALIFICIGSLVMMFVMEKPVPVREEPARPANNSIVIDLSNVREESLMETLSVLNELFGISDFEITEETYYRIKMEMWVRK